MEKIQNKKNGYWISPLNSKKVDSLLINKKQMEYKTYVLLEHMNPTSKNIFIRINKEQRQVVSKLPTWRPYLQVTFTDKDGKNKTIRYKATSNEIFQDEQIKLGILANEKFRPTEYTDLDFKNSVLTTNNPTVQKYLETHPSYDKFEGRCSDVPRREYTLYDKASEIKVSNLTTRRRLEAGNNIFELDLKGTQDLLYRIYGTSYKPSDIVDENHDTLIQYLDGSDEAIDKILEKQFTSDDAAKILVGKLLTSGILSFDKNINQVSKKLGSTWIDVKQISSEYSLAERQRHFIEFITSDAGKTLWNDLEKDLNGETYEVKVNDEPLVVTSTNITVSQAQDVINKAFEENIQTEKPNVVKREYKKRTKKKRGGMKPKKYSVGVTDHEPVYEDAID